jgi:hypothetical protein
MPPATPNLATSASNARPPRARLTGVPWYAPIPSNRALAARANSEVLAEATRTPNTEVELVATYSWLSR